MPSVSLLLCTRNRAHHLRPTLASIAATRVPSEMSMELVVVDNGSTDQTPTVVHEAQAPFPIRYITEPTPGASNARNAALKAARHDILLWTDDDTRVPEDWIAPMTSPIAHGEADIVAGGVRLADHLQRDWMEPWHHSLLASTAHRLKDEVLHDVVGANMAFGRHVLGSVPGFDPELGPGALGLCEESHFVERLVRLGYKVAPALDVEVVHHPDPSRLTTQALIGALEGLGRSQAFIRYHWRHDDPVAHESPLRTQLRITSLQAKAAVKDLWRPVRSSEEGLSSSEAYYVRQLAYLRQSVVERQRPRLYARYAAQRRIAPSSVRPEPRRQTAPQPALSSEATVHTR